MTGWYTLCSFYTERYLKLSKEILMNSDRMKGNWNELKGKAQQKWGDLTDDDLDKIEGSRTELVGKIQQQYGKSKEEAEREVDEFERTH